MQVILEIHRSFEKKQKHKKQNTTFEKSKIHLLKNVCGVQSSLVIHVSSSDLATLYEVPSRRQN